MDPKKSQKDGKEEKHISVIQGIRMALKWLSPPVKSELLRVIIVPLFMNFCLFIFLGCIFLHKLRVVLMVLSGKKDLRTRTFDDPMYELRIPRPLSIRREGSGPPVVLEEMIKQWESNNKKTD